MKHSSKKASLILNGQAFKSGDFFWFNIRDFFELPDHEARQLAKTILLMAAQYNQLKDLQELILLEREKHEQAPQGLYPKVGHITGRFDLLNRLLFGATHEVLSFIRRSAKRRFGTNVFRDLIALISGEDRKLWEMIVALARTGESKSSRKGQSPGQDQLLARALYEIRNNVSFHLERPENLVKGLDHHAGRANGHLGFVSLGETMSESRFYFADAATQGFVSAELKLDTDADFSPALLQLVGYIGKSYFAVIYAFLGKYMEDRIHQADFGPKA